MNFGDKYKSLLGYYNKDNQIDSYGVNHSGFSTFDELNYQNARIERENMITKQLRNQRITNFPQYRTNFWSRPANNNYGFGFSNIENATKQELNNLLQNQNTVTQFSISKQTTPIEQIIGAVQDLSRNYFDMKKDRTIGADDYFHCKANYEAAQRGKYGALAAQILGDEKEIFDYFKNRYYKGLSHPDALADYWHDKDVNNQGRQLAKNPLYSTSKKACSYQRVKGVNEKY